jgi:hypothetical protein
MTAKGVSLRGAERRSNLGDEAMSVSILVVDDEPDVADLFRQHFRRS